MSRLSKGPSFRLMLTSDLEHFNKWRQLYGPPFERKMFSVSTHYYIDKDDVKCFFSKVKVYIIDRKN